ncbi:sulfolipid-1 biosynthesis phthioceranic/hydroxyphthioceranic acid synthase [Mycobacterium parmense]|uniref:Phthioceranic/hydroxyphthioceranic acid synthase n=1 Tax=Mycobacterium parmense TaxID=185642 RepID=A0A7I7YRK4_9MYCO|nr:sulfolipid-1 biosynthesis phthioceranic/hydroxyphthioceranic acid synthase [Mycobacterium parmense]BBZ44465.1 polyketide synthase [Mycobacterium parmense]
MTIPVAVIGVACRLPGGIDSPERLWESLLSGDHLVAEIPRARWDADEYYDPEPGVPGRSVSRWGAFLDDVAGFDPEFFGIDEREAIALDPQHRLLLEASREAVEHAGVIPAAMVNSRTGVFVGLTHSDYQLMTAEPGATDGPHGRTGNTFSQASGRVAHTMGLRGPALTVDAACSSSLLAVHLACRSLGDGESDLALAGGAFVMLEPGRFLAETARGRLSPTGRCHAFDVAADGYVLGEACAMVLLKRLPDALRDGDRILAVVRGTAANQDGHCADSSTPSRTAQTEVYRAALANAGVDARSVGMVEAHGPGTRDGDPVEYACLAEVYGVESPCAVGSAKTNFGHTQAASGVLGLIKAVLSLAHGAIPENLHFTRLPDDLARVDTKLFVPQALTPWPHAGQHPRRAAVSSYGTSGTNVHAILEQAPRTSAHATHPGAAPEAPLLFALSSTSARELRRTAGRLADWVEAHDAVALPDLAYTLTRRRAHRPVRTTVVASGHRELAHAMRGIADGEAPYPAAVTQDDRGPVWVFSGQGSQWAGMGAGLLANEPVFAATVAQVEPLVARESGFSVTEAMASPQTVTGIDRVQPTLFAMQIALAETMKYYGVRPGAVIGHSLGEAAAAVVAGALSLDDGVRVICRRSRLMSTIAGAGAMAAVELPAKQVLSELTLRGVKDVVVAEVASPQSTVIGGAALAVRERVAAWEERDVPAREVAVDVASHSPQVDPILDELTDALAELNPTTPEVPFYSATSFDPREEPVCDNRYWVDNLRRTVRFAAAVRAALEDGHRVFAELAPHPLLVRAVEQTARSVDVPAAALACLRRGQDAPHGLLGFVGELHAAGAPVDFAVLYPGGRLVDAPLPTWTRRRLWLSPSGRRPSARAGSTGRAHPLLGPHVRLREQPERHVWQAEVGTAAQPWLADHRVGGAAVLPAAAYCEMALAAARLLLGETSEVRDIRFKRALPLGEDTTAGLSATSSSPGVLDFLVESDPQGGQRRRATAVLSAAADERPPAYDMPALLAAHPRRTDGAEVRNRLKQLGVQYGSAFTGLAAARTGDDATGTVLAEVALPGPIRAQEGDYGVHPALLDACLQSVEASSLVRGLGEGIVALPTSVRRLRLYGCARGAHYCYTRLTEVDDRGIEADLDVLDRHGAVLLSVRGLRCSAGTSADAHKNRVLNERLLTVEWQQRPLPEIPHCAAGAWLLISVAATADPAAALAAALSGHGAQCQILHCPPGADHSAHTQELGNRLRAARFAGVVIVHGAAHDEAPGDAAPGPGSAQHLVLLTRELLHVPGEPPRLYVVTRGAQTVLAGDRPDLGQAGLRGLIRVIGAEHPHLRATHVDVDATSDTGQLARHLLSGSDEDECAWRAGSWYTARLRAAPLRPGERRTAVAEHQVDGLRLRIREPGDLQTLELVACERLPPGPGRIEVAVAASGVNFADVLVAKGSSPGADGHPPQLGTDFAGVVTAVGPGVTGHRVGDRVGGFSEDGCWGTFVTCDARLAVTLPATLSEPQAAAITTATATAWHGLHDRAGISPGDRVLIHSATGGVGQAAIAIARAAGAEIFATAGSEERRELLRATGIEHVYDSRGTEFAEQIRRDTDGYGVDIVLNSLTGAARRAGSELLADEGHFIDIAIRGAGDDTRPALFPAHRNLTFHHVDLSLMSASHPHRVGKLLRTVYRLAADGGLPSPRHTVYPLTGAADAIRAMSAPGRSGKIVLGVPRAGRSRVTVPPERAQVFRPDGAYLVTGDLDERGLFLAEKLAEAGCGRIVLMSRAQPTRKARETIKLICAIGADVVVQCGDIAEAAAAHQLVAAATATGLPVRGVLHAAGVTEDATVANVSADIIESAWATKVYGAWNLHCALRAGEAAAPLDWFCSFSSAAALAGSPGRAAEAAANSWLDAFTRWRRGQGLAATAIAWGPWEQVGRGASPARDADVAIAPDEGAYALETLLRHDRGHTGYAPFPNAAALHALARRSRFAEAFRSTAQIRTGTTKLRAELSELPPEEWPTLLRRLVTDQISLILRCSIDPDRPLCEYGVDSLGALELRTRIENETGICVTYNDIAVTTIRGLAQLLCEKLTPA